MPAQNAEIFNAFRRRFLHRYRRGRRRRFETYRDKYYFNAELTRSIMVRHGALAERALLPVREVKPGMVTGNVDPGDWYAAENSFLPNPAP